MKAGDTALNNYIGKSKATSQNTEGNPKYLDEAFNAYSYVCNNNTRMLNFNLNWFS